MSKILAIGFFFLAGAANGVMDTLQFHFAQSMFANPARFDAPFWNPAQSWKNKYRDGDPAQGPRFPLSTTAFVFLTDAWHLAKFLMLKCIVLGALAFAFASRASKLWPTMAAWAIALHLAFQIGFTAAYR
jgi:hypothetical protein